MVEQLAQLIPVLIKQIGKNKPNPNDWQGWNALDVQIGAPQGTNCINWVINDGDSIQNEALNILQYIKANGEDKVIGYNSHFNRTITMDDVADKLRRGGYVSEANQLQAEYKKKVLAIAQANAKKNTSSANPTGTSPTGLSTTTKVIIGSVLLLTAIGVTIYIIKRKK
jgi:hypothetical protein